ncbi:proline--tRNA ligase [bacterium BMS3Bbin05]|nr:proline--tRNA ligase [bacterium BMS3Bbin05]HDL20822.1 proline--tRNA ligase [Nitrospirota bacterium]
MRYSQLFIPTLREAPADAEAISHKLLVRAGFVRQLASGLYIYLPIGWKVLNKINTIIREEMNAIGAQEISMPVLHPAEIWQQTGRWNEIGDEMFRLRDRKGSDMCLGMTHEEIITWLASREIRSYKELPQIWYQIQTKLRDEARPKSGILRTREFLMKDSYSFDTDERSLQKSYNLHIEAYNRIFERCGLKFYRVDSDPGMMGGAIAHEYMAPSEAGEDDVALCAKCGYSANVELAESVPPAIDSVDRDFEEIETPEKRTVGEVSAFLKLSPAHFIKSLLVISEKEPVLALIRGDQKLHENKLQKIIGNFRHASRDEAKEILGVEAGFIGPMGHNVKTVADEVLQKGCFISGANKPHYHAGGIKAGREFSPGWADIHVAQEGDGCPGCGEPLHIEKVIEIGNTFKLGTKYSMPLRAFYLDESGREKPVVMGSYGIGPARVAAAAVEQSHDDNGIIWPESIAPFDVIILPLNVKDEKTRETAEHIHNELIRKNVDALLDDRDERAGTKFKDADLIGIPLQIVIGERNLKEGLVEIKSRSTGKAEKIKIDKAVKTACDNIA